MSIQDLGSLGEFFGSIAVVITLIYLAVQVRQNTGALQATARESASQGSQRLILARIEDVGLASAFVKAQSGGELDAVETYRLEQYAWASMRMLEVIFKHYEQGLFDQEDWNGYREVIRYWMGHEYFLRAWGTSKAFFRPSFVREVEGIVGEGIVGGA